MGRSTLTVPPWRGARPLGASTDLTLARSPLGLPPFVAALRGGATAAAAATTAGTATKTAPLSKESTRGYRLQQQLHLQSRGLQLRQELIARGLDALKHGATATGGDESSAPAKPVDWDCALSTSEHPKSCLYSFDAEEGAKVIAPIDTTQWITLTSLNRLRRSDPTKVEPLWHSQYAVLQSWFHPSSQYSLYSHLSPVGTALSLLLDVPWLMALTMGAVLAIGLLLTLPVWERALTLVLTSRLVWVQWPNWGRFVHAALPLKLLLGQMAWRVVAVSFARLYQRVRSVLVEWECQMWQESIPLTVLEGEQYTRPMVDGDGAPSTSRSHSRRDDSLVDDEDSDDSDA